MVNESEGRVTPAQGVPMSDGSTEFTHPKFRMWLAPDGVVHLVWVPQIPSGIEDATAAINAMIELTDGRQAPLLVDTRVAGPQDRAARMEFIRRHEVVSAVALIAGNPLSRMMANFFINVSRPKAPTRLFEDEASALAWLKEFVE